MLLLWRWSVKVWWSKILPYFLRCFPLRLSFSRCLSQASLHSTKYELTAENHQTSAICVSQYPCILLCLCFLWFYECSCSSSSALYWTGRWLIFIHFWRLWRKTRRSMGTNPDRLLKTLRSGIPFGVNSLCPDVVLPMTAQVSTFFSTC